MISQAADKKVKTAELKDNISFSDFTRIVLAEQMRYHSKFLSIFREEFRDEDIENAGFLSREAFGRCLETLDQENKVDIGALVEVADKYETGAITFSTAVDALSAQHVQREGRNITLLQYFYDYYN